VNPKPYFILTGSILGMVGVLHFLRIFLSVSVIAGGWEVPLWLSWLGFPACIAISGWGFLLAFRRK